MKTRAFTLIELLVVIAIIAVLMAILMPTLRAAKDHARRIHCISNVKSLALGWFMYQEDNDGELVPGHTNPGQWVLRPSDGDTVEQKKQAIRDGLLYPYVGKEVDVYACPSDMREKDPRNYIGLTVPNTALLEHFDGYFVGWGNHRTVILVWDLESRRIC